MRTKNNIRFLLALMLFVSIPIFATTKAENKMLLKTTINAMKPYLPMKLAEGLQMASWTYNDNANTTHMKYVFDNQQGFSLFANQGKEFIRKSAISNIGAMLKSQPLAKLLLDAIADVNPTFYITYACTNGKQIVINFTGKEVEEAANATVDDNNPEKTLREEIDKMNEQLPIKVDELTEWVSAYIDRHTYLGNPSVVFVYDVYMTPEQFSMMHENKAILTNVLKNMLKENLILKQRVNLCGFNFKLIYQRKDNPKDRIMVVLTAEELKNL